MTTGPVDKVLTRRLMQLPAMHETRIGDGPLTHALDGQLRFIVERHVGNTIWVTSWAVE